MLEEERAHLRTLPLLGMQYFEEVKHTVCDDACVLIDHSSYAARPAPIGSESPKRKGDRESLSPWIWWRPDVRCDGFY